MKQVTLYGYQVELNAAATQSWYAAAAEWGCTCGHCRNFLALARQKALPSSILDTLDALGVPPEKATYVGELFTDEAGIHYQFSYRLCGSILSAPRAGGQRPRRRPLLPRTLPLRRTGFPRAPLRSGVFPHPAVGAGGTAELTLPRPTIQRRERRPAMKQRKAVPLFVPVLWFITTLLWTITFCRNLSHNGTSGSLLLQAATVLVSLAAALVNLHRYRRDRNHTDW